MKMVILINFPGAEFSHKTNKNKSMFLINLYQYRNKYTLHKSNTSFYLENNVNYFFVLLLKINFL